MRNGRHVNKDLQKDFTFFHGKNFSFEILEECPIEKLYDRECYYIAKYNSCNSKLRYNKNKIKTKIHFSIRCSRSVKAEKNFSFRCTEEQYDKIRELAKKACLSQADFALSKMLDLIPVEIREPKEYPQNGKGKNGKVREYTREVMIKKTILMTPEEYKEYNNKKK